MAEITINRLRGFYEKVTSFPSGYTNDGVFGITVPSGPSAGNYIRIKKGPVSSQEVGILYDGTNQATKINAVLAVSGVNELHFDSSDATDITVSGTLNCGGKKLVFRNHNRIIGTNTINNFVLDCPLTDQCFTIGSTLTNARSVHAVFTCEHFGALGANADETAILQKTSDTVIANNYLPRVIRLFSGKTYQTSGWVLYKFVSGDYQQFSISIIGEESTMGGNVAFTATLNCTNPNGFGIGIHLAAGFTIKGICMIGQLSISGVSSYSEFFSRPYATFASSGSNPAPTRDSQYSPNAGIVIDPFKQISTPPPDGGYPDYNGAVTALNPLGINWYRGVSASPGSGSTAGTILDINLACFTVGILFSPNGQTQQGENMTLGRINANIMKAVTGWGQRESKGCMFKEGYSINLVHTIVDCSSWGLQSGTAPYVKGYTCSGTVVRFITGGSQHAVTFEDIYTETSYKIGDFNAQAGATKFIGCNFGMATVLPNVIPQCHFSGVNLEFDGCTIRYYDDLFNKRLVFQGYNITFNDCYFDLPPIGITGQDHPGTQKMMNINAKNCFYGNGSHLFGFNSLKGYLNAANDQSIAYGHMTFEQQNENNFGRVLKVYECGGYEDTQVFFSVGTYTVNSTAHTAVFNAGNINITVGQYIIYYPPSSAITQVLGRVSAINRSTGDVSLVDVPLETANGAGSSNVYIIADYNRFKGRFTGVYTAGSPNITSVFGAPSINERDLYTGNVILSYDDTTKIAVTTANSVNTTSVSPELYSPATRFGCETITYTKPGLPTDASFSGFDTGQYFPGDIWIFAPVNTPLFSGGQLRKFKCIQSGYIFPLAIGQTKKALFTEIFDTDFKIISSGTSDFSVLIPAGTLIKGWKLLATAFGMTVTTGTTNLGTDIDPGTTLIAGTSQIVNYSYYSDTDTTWYFNGITGTGGTLNINFF